ncbi:hypothetical protein QEH52_17340, partial [Coraliomargarita sp. SDUM461003]
MISRSQAQQEAGAYGVGFRSQVLQPWFVLGGGAAHTLTGAKATATLGATSNFNRAGRPISIKLSTSHCAKCFSL